MALGPETRKWLKACQKLPERDLDNFMLFSGPEGSGKSTVGGQVMRYLIPDLPLGQVTFTVRDAIDAIRRGDTWADEFQAGKRKGAYGDTVDFLDLAQVCRGLNRHIAIMFPHPNELDQTILNTRIRYWINVPTRGVAWVRERQAFYNPDATTDVWWKLICRFRFTSNSGTWWEAYKRAKLDAMLSRNNAADEEERPAEDLWDPTALRGMREVLQ